MTKYSQNIHEGKKKPYKLNNKKTVLASLLGAGLAVSASSALAVIEEVVVTAEFRESTTMDTAIAISAFDSNMLKKFRMQETRHLAAQTPNVQIEENFGRASPRIVIRGLLNSDFGPQASSPFTVYSDGVILTSPTIQGFSMFDLERVEILRGPQGTLYGRNSTSGSVNYISARPTEELEGYAELTAARFGQLRGEAAISGPLSDNVRGRIAVTRGVSDGWMTNVVNNNETPALDDLSVRTSLEIDLSEDIQIFAKFQYSDSEGDSAVFSTLFPVNPVSGVPNNVFLEDRRNFESDVLDSPENIRVYEGSLQLDWDLGDMVFTSITGYNDHTRFTLFDVDFSPIPLIHESVDSEGDQFSQEFRLASNTEGAFSWIAGLYYMQEDSYNDTRFEAFTFDPTAPTAIGQGFIATQDLETTAGFVQLDYDINEQWKVGLGLRYTDDKKSVTHDGSAFYLFNRVSDTAFVDVSNIITPYNNFQEDSQSWSSGTGSLSVQYRPDDRTLVYANFGKGFKGGAFNLNTADPLAVNEIGPETLFSYEFGLKWESEERDIVLDAAIYYYDYEDLQQFVFSDLGSGTLSSIYGNADKAESIGAELNLMYAPVPEALIRLGFGWADGEFEDFATLTDAGDPINLAGNQFPGAAELNFNALAQYDVALMDGWTLTPQIDASWRNGYYGEVNNVDTLTLGGQTVQTKADANWDVNLRLTLASEGGLTITAFVEDLGEEDGDYQYSYLGGDSLGLTFSRFDQPQTFGVSVRQTF